MFVGSCLFWMVALVCAPADSPTQGEASKKDLELLQGTWRMADMLTPPGMPKPPKDVMDNMRLVIQGKKMIIQLHGTTREETFSIDASKSPKWIDSTTTIQIIPLDPKAKRQEQKKNIYGIYEITGDTWRVCENSFGDDQDDRTKRPKELKPSGPFTVTVWNRVKMEP